MSFPRLIAWKNRTTLASLLRSFPTSFKAWIIQVTIFLEPEKIVCNFCTVLKTKRILDNERVHSRVNQFSRIKPQIQEQVHNLILNNVYLNHFGIYCDLKMHGLKWGRGILSYFCQVYSEVSNNSENPVSIKPDWWHMCHLDFKVTWFCKIRQVF